MVPTSSEAAQAVVDLDAASALSGMHPEMIQEVMRAKLVVCVRESSAGEPYFDDEAIYRLRQIEYLRTHQRAQMRTIRLVMQLLDRLETTEREVRWLRERLG